MENYKDKDEEADEVKRYLINYDDGKCLQLLADAFCLLSMPAASFGIIERMKINSKQDVFKLQSNQLLKLICKLSHEK